MRPTSTSSSPPRPTPAAEGADPIDQRLADLATTRWQAEVDELLARWEEQVRTQPLARARERELREWADRAHFGARINEADRIATGLGDSVITLWPQPGGWPMLQVWEPGFYFPVLDDESDRGAYPSEVHLAWEYEHTNLDGTTEMRVRRVSLWLEDIGTSRSALVAGEPQWVDEDGYVVATPPMRQGEYVGADGGIWRRYPWAPTEPGSRRTCMYSDGSWPLSDVQDGRIDALSANRAIWHQRPTDLLIDFLPVVHVPNTPSSGEHYGQAAIDLVAQVLDDVAQADTNTMNAAQYLGDPTIALSGASVPEGTLVLPGQVHGLGEKGSMDVLDLTAGLTALMALGDRLLDRFWVNGRVPREMVGRVDASSAVSGLAL
ncbi:MAG: hypothetical protein R2711_17725, partial [Acidimicrobiales bacterium]